jgi:hypothetical protein
MQKKTPMKSRNRVLKKFIKEFSVIELEAIK